MGRQDDRYDVELWWELNRHRFLPRPDHLPLADELFEILLDAADGGSETVRERVVLSLGRTGDPRALEAIECAISEEAEGVRLAGVLALGFSGARQSAAYLKELAANGEASLNERVFAILAVGLLDDPKNAPFLCEVLDEEWEPNVRTAAAFAAGLIGDPLPVEALGRIMLDVHPLRSPETAMVGDMRIRTGLRCAAARALGEILTPRSYDYLVEAVEGGPPQVRAAAAMVLADAPGTAGLPALRRILEERGPLPLRQQALLGLAERRDSAAVEEARRILESPPERNGLMGPVAALALGLCRDPDQAALLIMTVRDKEAGRRTRAAAALALGVGGYREAAKELAKAVDGTRIPRLLGWGMIADAMLGGRSAKPLAKRILSESDLPGPRRDAVMTLRILADPETADLLVKELTDSYYVNREAALALAVAAPERAARELSAKLRDPNVFAGRFAAHSIGLLLDPDPDGRLAHLLARTNLLCGAPVLKACLFVENEYLCRLVRNF
jgi:HEAT repeat protein